MHGFTSEKTLPELRPTGVLNTERVSIYAVSKLRRGLRGPSLRHLKYANAQQLALTSEPSKILARTIPNSGCATKADASIGKVRWIFAHRLIIWEGHFRQSSPLPVESAVPLRLQPHYSPRGAESRASEEHLPRLQREQERTPVVQLLTPAQYDQVFKMGGRCGITSKSFIGFAI